MNNIEFLTDIIKKNELLEKCNLSRIGIFGSYARNEDSNDIDILVDSDNYKNLLKFETTLNKLTSKKIDLVIEKYANPIVMYRARKDLHYVS